MKKFALFTMFAAMFSAFNSKPAKGNIAVNNNEPAQGGYKNPGSRKARKEGKVKKVKSAYQKKHARIRIQKHSRQMNRKNLAA